MKVELMCAGVPFLSIVAVHYWFVVDNSGKRERWEVWQSQNAGGMSRGHIHRDLKAPYEGLGGSPAQSVQVWTDAEAEEILKVLHSSWDHYPYLNTYHYVPGPNSNTYIAWVLQQAHITVPLGRKGIGKGYLC